MGIPDHEIVRFKFLKVELRTLDWRRFIASENPVAAALLVKMGYNEKEKREMRSAYLRMLLRLSYKLDDARIALLMSVADLYFEPDQDEDEKLLDEILKDYPKERVKFMELMPAWKRWGYEEGMEKGKAEGKAEGLEKGMEKGKAEERASIIRRMLTKGFTPEQVADTLEIPLTEVEQLGKH